METKTLPATYPPSSLKYFSPLRLMEPFKRSPCTTTSPSLGRNRRRPIMRVNVDSCDNAPQCASSSSSSSTSLGLISGFECATYCDPMAGRLLTQKFNDDQSAIVWAGLFFFGKIQSIKCFGWPAMAPILRQTEHQVSIRRSNYRTGSS